MALRGNTPSRAVVLSVVGFLLSILDLADLHDVSDSP